VSQHDSFKKGLHVFFPQKNFFIQMNFGIFFFLQLVIINFYNFPSTKHVFFLSYLNKHEFLKMS